MKQHTVASIRAGLLAKEFSSVELTREALAHAERENPATNAYLRFSPERALAAAEKVDEKIKQKLSVSKLLPWANDPAQAQQLYHEAIR